ncbi:hypothetical protein GCM10010424_37190 [Streptomyces lienomycini]
MVRRLVEQQQVGGLRDESGQIHAAALAVGQLAEAQPQFRRAEEAEGEQGVGVLVGTSPPSGRSRPATSLRRVDFPAPLSPISPAFSPGFSVRETWSRTVRPG